MDFIKKLNPKLFLRLGFGIMYLYSGFDLFYNPQHWYGFVPHWFSKIVTQVIPIETYLRAQGVGELMLGLLFLAPVFGPWGLRAASALAATEMFLIDIFSGIDPITFRDIGLLGSAIALLILSFNNNPK